MTSIAPKVLYRGPPGLKTWLYYFMGGVFISAGAYQGHVIRQHLSWPLYSSDPENPVKLAPYSIRNAAGGGLTLLCGIFGIYFFWTPTRLATRVTLYPATAQVGIRSASPPIRALLPASLRSKKGAEISKHDRNERLYPLHSLYRRDSVSAQEVAAFVTGQGVQKLDKKGKLKKIPSSLLLGQKITLGFQLEAAPFPLKTFQEQTQNMYKLGWINFKISFRGNTDWSLAPGQTSLSEAESKAKQHLHPTEPWFLDRKNFDRLFPAS